MLDKLKASMGRALKNMGAQMAPEQALATKQKVVVTDERGNFQPITLEIVAHTTIEAAEKAASAVAVKRCKETVERSWLFSCVVDERAKHRVVSNMLIKSEVA